jgi:osmotically inducible lipoprotein OsmB
MKTIHGMTFSTVAAAMRFGLAGCSNMSTQDKSTAIGGMIGHEVGDK